MITASDESQSVKRILTILHTERYHGRKTVTVSIARPPLNAPQLIGKGCSAIDAAIDFLGKVGAV